MGIKAAIGSLGSLLAPALVTLVIRYVSPQGMFLISAALIVFTALVVLLALRLPSRTEVSRDLAWEASQERVIAAQTALRNVTISAATARRLREAA